MLGNANCNNCSAICDKTIFHEGRWYYDCQNFTGDFTQYNDISIVWDGWDWLLVVGNSAQEYIDQTDYNYNLVDAQYSTSETVCIDPDATSVDIPGEEHYGPQTALINGSLECLDGQDWVFRYDSRFSWS